MVVNIICAIILDYILGDPQNFPHPVKLMGRIIGFEDKILRSSTGDKDKLKIYGFLISVINIMLTFFIGHALIQIVSFNRIFQRLVTIYLMYTCIAAKSMEDESMKVYDALEDSLEDARYRLSFIVGRETKDLNEDKVIKATVETISENTCDGVIAPLIYMFFFGAPGGLTYKMINTMDSMLGYKNEDYEDFGRYPALIDDIFNFLPARITGLFMCLSQLDREKILKGLKIMIRDRKNHLGPNPAYPEGAAAGLLGIELEGDSYYHGVLVKKPTIGDQLVETKRDHIFETLKIMYRTELFTLVLYIGYRVIKLVINLI